MRSINVKRYIYLFVVIMGFASGAATDMDSKYLDEALLFMAEAEGASLLGLSLTDLMLNTALICWCSIAEGKIRNIMTVAALLGKAMLMGLLCRALAADINVLRVLMILLTTFGGGCICFGLAMQHEPGKTDPRRITTWLCGAAVECIIIPSAARTWMLLFN